jgi:anti-anti-sigma regulatory factor
MSSPIDDTAQVARQREEPAIITLTGPLTQQAVSRLGALIAGGTPSRTVIVDVSDISDFDSRGTSALLALQELAGADRVVVVGVREAAARLLAIDDLLPAPAAEATSTDDTSSSGRPRLMPGLMMVSPDDAATAEALEATLDAGLDRGISIVVADIAGYPTMPADVVQALVSAGHKAERRGQELVLVNASPAAATALAGANLGSTTHIAKPR